MSRRSRARTLRLDALDARIVPVVFAVFDPTAGVLTVAGDQVNNSITVGRDVAGNIFVNSGAVPIAGGTPTVANTTLIRILGHRGNDTLQLDETNGALPTAVIKGGAGNDILVGGSGNDTFVAGGGNDTVDGNAGNDVAFLGLGDDTFTWDPGDGSDKVEGDLGSDRLVVNGENLNENFDLSANGTQLRLTRDLGGVTLDVAGAETVDVNALGGADRITINNLAATAVRQVNANLASTLGGTTGDGQVDQVVLNGTALSDAITVNGTAGVVSATGMAAAITINTGEVTDTLFVNSLGGNDQVVGTGLPTGFMRLSLDGGAGNDTLRGSQAADTFIGGDGNDFVIGDNGDDTALLGAGNDTFQWDPGDGSDVLEGQDGLDRMIFNGGNVNENIDISANGGRVRFFRNIATITMDLDGVERVDFNARGGIDNIVVNDLTGTDLKDIRLDLAMNPPAIGGDSARDTVSIFGTNGDDTVTVATIAGQTWVTGLAAKVRILHAEAQTDELTVNGLAGNDTMKASTLAVSGPLLTLDGGIGNDSLTGSAGDDVLLGGDDNDLLIALAGDDLIDGGNGDDSISAGAGEDILNGGAGTDTMDGGAGSDVVVNGEVLTNI